MCFVDQAQKERKETLIGDLENLKASYAKLNERVHASTEKVLALSEGPQNKPFDD